jgi:DNA-binding GntR family transcriptional regulator
MQGDTLQRSNLSEAIVERLRAMIIDGRLGAGERLNEVHLAQRLGVSRTPLREALTRLAAEGAVNAIPRIGYFVCPLTIEEFEQIYPMRAILDPAALRLAGLPRRAAVERLKSMNAKIENERDPARALELDDAWHRELLSSCPNKILLGLIEQFILRTRRYELALMREQKNVARAAVDHRAVIAALDAGDLDGACAALQANMESGREPILTWLKSRT